MLKLTPTDTWLPAWVPESTVTVSILLMLCSVIQSTVSNDKLQRAGALPVPLSLTPRYPLGPAPKSHSLTRPHVHVPQTGGYDGSMMNGLNILPTYTDYFGLTPATVGLNTASVFIGSFFGTLASGVLADALGRRPAIFWGAAATLAGVVVQTAAQDTAMFVVGRVVLGLGSAVSGIASSVYLSETFPSRWRAWGAGLLNDFY